MGRNKGAKGLANPCSSRTPLDVLENIMFGLGAPMHVYLTRNDSGTEPSASTGLTKGELSFSPSHDKCLYSTTWFDFSKSNWPLLLSQARWLDAGECKNIWAKATTLGEKRRRKYPFPMRNTAEGCHTWPCDIRTHTEDGWLHSRIQKGFIEISVSWIPGKTEPQ